MKNPNYNLILTGFMGTGKTTIGEMVAQRLGREFVDTDHMITERLGKSVPEIFSAYGEPFFRAIEASICNELGDPKQLVISTGGGALVNYDNARAIAGKGNIVICLTAEPDEILRRLENDTRRRPLIDKHDTAQDRKTEIASLLASRKSAYERIRIRIDTTDKSAEDMVEEVLKTFEYEMQRNATKIPVDSPTNRYTILCDSGLLHDVPQLLQEYHLSGRVIVATNETIAPLYGEQLVERLPDAALVTMPDGEIYKNLDTVRQLYKDFAEAGLDRNGVVIALGGGVVGDTVGFAAASYMRGVRLVQIPTSLLSMVDSSVGGKVGVDIPEGKNLVGAFKQPELVIIDTDVLKSLPPVEVRCGLAEAMKHGFLNDPSLLECAEAIAQGDADALKRTIQVKVNVVERDPYERGERAFLNLGHTFAHAIERVSGYTWRHGEAVSVGLVAAARLSEQITGFATAEDVEGLMQEIGLPTTYRDLDPNELWAAMHTDKKWKNGRSHFVLLESIGMPKSVYDVPKETVIDVLKGVRES